MWHSEIYIHKSSTLESYWMRTSKDWKHLDPPVLHASDMWKSLGFAGWISGL